MISEVLGINLKKENFVDKSRCFEHLVEMCLRLRPRVWGTKAIPYLLKKTLTLPKHISDLTTFVTLVVGNRFEDARVRGLRVQLHIVLFVLFMLL